MEVKGNGMSKYLVHSSSFKALKLRHQFSLGEGWKSGLLPPSLSETWGDEKWQWDIECQIRTCGKKQNIKTNDVYRNYCF